MHGMEPAQELCSADSKAEGAEPSIPKNRTTGFGICPVEFGLALGQYFLIMLIPLGNSKTATTISESNLKQALLNTGQNYEIRQVRSQVFQNVWP